MTEKTNPLWFMGIIHPNPIGYYSGNPRDFAREIESEENDFDSPVEDFLPDAADGDYNSDSFHKYALQQFDNPMKTLTEDFTQTYPLWAIAQSHIDAAWKWRYAQTIKKVQVTFRKAVTHMNYYPEFTFAGSQPALFEMIQHTDPVLFAQIQEKVTAGQFELVGGCWIEADPRMPSGEAFARGHLYGQRYFFRNFGKIADVAWFQDSFGYSIQIPQFSARSGMHYFFTNKIMSNKETIFPFMHFHWFSPDGSHILAWETPGGFGAIRSFETHKHTRRLLHSGTKTSFTYADDAPEEQAIWSDELVPVVGMDYGKGDGGHGPTAVEYATIRYLQETGHNIRHVPASEFYAELDKIADRLPEWHDELYYEFHRGTLTTHHLVKYMTRRHEWLALAVENFAMFAHITSDLPFPYERITRAWKNICLMHMHDVLPGSSVPEVYDDCHDFWVLHDGWFNEIADNGLAAVNNALLNPDEMKEGANGILVCNPLFVPRADPIEVPWDSAAGVPTCVREGRSGATYPVQLVPADPASLEPLESRPTRLIIEATQPAWGAVSFECLDSGAPETPGVTIEDAGDTFVLQNRFYRVSVDKQSGAITSIQMLDPEGTAAPVETVTGPSNVLKFYEDILLSEPAWNLNPNYRTSPLVLDELTVTPAQVMEEGPVRCSVEFKTHLAEEDLGNATFTQRISLYANSEGIDLDTLVDWNLKWCTVKCFFEIAGDPQESIAEVAYGTIHRSLYPTANHDKPRWENHMQTFLTIPARDNSFCFNILNGGKYGYDNIEGNKIGITMIRSPMYTDLPNESWLKAERAARADAGLGEVPEHADLGNHLIRLRLMPRRGTWEDQHIERDAHAFNCPPFSRTITYAPLSTGNFITASNGVEVTSFKFAEEGNEHLEDWENQSGEVNTEIRVLRAYETLGTAHEGSISIRKLRISKVQPADLLERSTGDDLPFEYDEEYTQTTFAVQWAPHEIKTFLLYR